MGILLLIAQLQAVSSAELKTLLKPHDRTLVVHAWASWCVPCLAELPELVAELGKRRVDVLWVDLDEKPEPPARVWKKLGKVRGRAVRPATYEALHDLDDKWEGELPATWVLAANGNIVVSKRGSSDLPELLKMIDQTGRGK